MKHKFDASNKSKLDNPRRREVLPPYKVLNDVGLKEGDTLVDVGAGIGYFSIPAAEIIGAAGKVFALDLSLDMLEDIDKKAEINGLKNIRTIVTEEYNLKVESNLADLVFICAVLHEVEEIDRFLVEVKRILKPEGKLAIVDWKKQEADMGPPMNHRLDLEEAKSALVRNGFNNMNWDHMGDYFYYVTAIK